MNLKKAALIVVVVGAAGLVAAVAWPAGVDSLYPGWGAHAVAIRNGLPGGLGGLLPAYPPVAVASNAAPAAGAANGAARTGGAAGNQAAPAAGARPAVSITVATVQRGPMTYRVDTVGTVQPMASVALRTRIDAAIQSILVPDGAEVTAGQPLVQLDSRQVQAQIEQAKATLAHDQAQLDQANRDLLRFQDLMQKGSGTQLQYDNQVTLVASLKASVLGDQASLDNLNVQLGWYTISAPITGRLGAFTSKPGNIIRAADNTATGILATINQMAPIYVSFTVPQAMLPDLRAALAAGAGDTTATPQGSKVSSQGKLAFVDNAVDPGTGTVTIRAVMPNKDEALWPGQLVNLRINLRVDPDVVSIPREATQASSAGTFVYIVTDGVAHIHPVKEGRQQEGRDVVTDGLQGGETVVTTGGLLLTDGARVQVQNGQTNRGAI